VTDGETHLQCESDTRKSIVSKARSYIRWISVICLGLVVLASLGFLLAVHEKDFTELPLSENKYLKDIKEPIKHMDSIICADGGSLGLLFKDSRQVIRGVCLEYDVEFNEKNVSFGGMVPDPNTRVPIAGIEEKALLGLLQRWQRQDPEAQELVKRLADKRTPFWSGSETQEQRAKAFAIGFTRRLLERN
jgi:hypothetical protein